MFIRREGKVLKINSIVEVLCFISVKNGDFVVFPCTLSVCWNYVNDFLIRELSSANFLFLSLSRIVLGLCLGFRVRI